MEDALFIKIDGENIGLTDILGTRKDITGAIVEIDLDKHAIYVKLSE
jgi:predicted RNA-binding protein